MMMSHFSLSFTAISLGAVEMKVLDMWEFYHCFILYPEFLRYTVMCTCNSLLHTGNAVLCAEVPYLAIQSFIVPLVIELPARVKSPGPRDFSGQLCYLQRHECGKQYSGVSPGELFIADLVGVPNHRAKTVACHMLHIYKRAAKNNLQTDSQWYFLSSRRRS